MLLAAVTAIKLKGGPDVFGPNGLNYMNTDPSMDMAQIGINITTEGTGANCEEGYWATVHYQAFLGTGRLVSDSRTEGTGRPTTFTLGNSEVFKCWDLAIP
jgi:FKBP-type peptidyl-prolyl cis-trans isomerase